MPTDLDFSQDVRLTALERYRILDTAPEPAFDDIVSLAASFCEAPIALIGLMDRGRQWFKARIGLEAEEVPIDDSVCIHALRQPGLLVIPDLTHDARTRDNPWVLGAPRLRFYAGAPLLNADGVALGTLCVLDTVAHPAGLSARQALALGQLSRQVMALLDMRAERMERHREMAGALRASALSLALARSNEVAQEAGRIGTFELDVASGQVQVSAEFCRLFGLPQALVYAASALDALAAPEDRPCGFSELRRREGGAPLDADYRIHRGEDGALRWIGRRADVTRDAAGLPVTISGMVQDITERKLGGQRLAALMELGDVLRNATTEAEVLRGATAILGRTLDASRVGYARIGPCGREGEVPPTDWTAPGTLSVAGRHPASSFPATLALMEAGVVQAISDVESEPGIEQDREGYRQIGARAVINAPQASRGELTGVLFVHAASPRLWSEEERQFVRGVSDRVHGALARLRAEAVQQVLNHELSHRLKNTLAMVQAIASQTLRRVTPREPVRALEQRLHALSAAHEVLLQYNWTRAPMRHVVERVFQAIGQAGHVEVGGPDLMLGQRSALTLSMLLHELATNAAKYGALSVEAGRVTLCWEIVKTLEGDILALHWRELGGPTVAPPERHGFGSTLIGMGLGGTGEVDLRYPSSGVELDLRAPLADVLED